MTNERQPWSLGRPPRGGGIFSILALIATAILTGGIGVGIFAIIDANSCLVNVFWGCSGSGGGGGGGGGGPGGNGGSPSSNYCVSAPNACGKHNVGQLQNTCPANYTLTAPPGAPVANAKQITDPDTCYKTTSCINGGNVSSDLPIVQPNMRTGDPGLCYEVDKQGDYITQTATQTCSATTPPPNSTCTAPVINPTDFSADPTTVNSGDPSTLTWNVTGVTDCTITSDTGFTHTGGASGSVSTGPITQSGTYTLTCEDGSGGPTASKSLKIIVNPHYKEL